MGILRDISGLFLVYFVLAGGVLSRLCRLKNMVGIYSQNFTRLCSPLLLEISYGQSIKMDGCSFYFIVIQIYYAHDLVIIREEKM